MEKKKKRKRKIVKAIKVWSGKGRVENFVNNNLEVLYKHTTK